MEEKTGGKLSGVLSLFPLIDIWIRPKKLIPRLGYLDVPYWGSLITNSFYLLRMLNSGRSMATSYPLGLPIGFVVSSWCLSASIAFFFSLLWIHLDATTLKLSSLVFQSTAPFREIRSATVWNLCNKLTLHIPFVVLTLLLSGSFSDQPIRIGSLIVGLPYFPVFFWFIQLLTLYRIWLYWQILAQTLGTSMPRAAGIWAVSRLVIASSLIIVYLLTRTPPLVHLYG